MKRILNEYERSLVYKKLAKILNETEGASEGKMGIIIVDPNKMPFIPVTFPWDPAGGFGLAAYHALCLALHGDNCADGVVLSPNGVIHHDLTQTTEAAITIDFVTDDGE